MIPVGDGPAETGPEPSELDSAKPTRLAWRKVRKDPADPGVMPCLKLDPRRENSSAIELGAPLRYTGNRPLPGARLVQVNPAGDERDHRELP
jgi:hypothetical protein